MSNVFYSLYRNHNDKLIVVCLQDFDLPDYVDAKFVKDQEGNNLSWDTEKEAILFLNSSPHWDKHEISPEYRTDIVYVDPPIYNEKDFSLEDLIKVHTRKGMNRYEAVCRIVNDLEIFCENHHIDFPDIIHAA